MTNKSALLRVAVEDNIAWCSRICSVHGSNEIRSPMAWTNLAVSPPFYPNIITRMRGAQNDVVVLVEKVRRANRFRQWGIKDSFGDLTLPEQSFERALVGHWYGGKVSSGDLREWRTVSSPAELRVWEKAWGSIEATVFPSALLEDHRIKFWFTGATDTIQSGFISFHTGFSLGLSNWFSLEGHSFEEIGVLNAAALASHGLPVVCWSTSDLSDNDMGFKKLGPLQVWISR